MKKIAATLLALGVSSVGLAAPAAAYDRDAYAYGASHMIGFSDVPKSLNVKRGAYFNADVAESTFVCGDDSKTVTFPGGKYAFSISYNGKGQTDGINVSVNQYASANKAIAAFDKLKAGLKRCEGESSGQESYGSDDDASVDSWSRLNTTGVVPLVTVAGVESVFLNQNYQDVTTGEYPGTYTSDSYTVYTLVNDVIISTNRSTGSELNLSTKERRAVNQVAFNAVTRWVD